MLFLILVRSTGIPCINCERSGSVPVTHVTDLRPIIGTWFAAFVLASGFVRLLVCLVLSFPLPRCFGSPPATHFTRRVCFYPYHFYRMLSLSLHHSMCLIISLQLCFLLTLSPIQEHDRNRRIKDTTCFTLSVFLIRSTNNQQIKKEERKKNQKRKKINNQSFTNETPTQS